MSGPEVEAARTVFSAAHFIYIPLCVFAGVIIGWILGARSAQSEIQRLRGLLATAEEQAAEQRAHLGKN